MSTPESIESLLQELDGNDVLARIAVQKRLLACGPAAVEPLITLLSAGTIKQVACAITVLGESGDRRAIEPLIQMLRAAHVLLRMNAAKALVKFNEPQVITALLESLNDRDELVQSWVLTSLGALGNREVVRPIVAFLEHTPSPDMRYMAIRALGSLGDPQAIVHILPYRDDENHHVRADASKALASLGYREIPEKAE